jgi:hypothetical protein
VRQLTTRIASAVLLVLTAALVAGAARAGTAVPAGAQPPATVRLDPRATRVDWSDGPFTVRVELSDLDHHGEIGYDDDRDTVPDRTVSSEGLAALEFVLHFDPAILQVTDVQAGDFIRSAGRSTYCLERTPEPGQFAVGCASTGSAPGRQGSGTLATVTLTPLADGTTYLALEADLAGPLGDPIDATVEGGIVEVFGAPAVTPTPGPSGPTEESGDTPTVVGGGDLSDVTLPEGDLGPAADGDEASAQVLPSTGAGYETPDAALLPRLLGGVLAAAGVAMLYFAFRLGAPAPRS